MLDELCKTLNNWFVAERDRHFGTFTISDGIISPSDFLQDGQYYRVIGSAFCDGVYKFGDTENKPPKDEEFEGAVWAMRVPPAVVRLSEEIDEWVKKYGEKALSPFSSESFGGYSYSKSSSYGSGSSSNDWRDAFAARLKEWRKI